MPPVVFVMLGAGALLHALWNVLLKRSEDPLATATRAMGFGLLVVTPLAAIAWWLTGRPTLSLPALGLAAGSAVVELLYFIFLSAAYRRGDLSTVYPIARGTAPLIAVAIGLLILGERLHQGAYVGVALLVAGIWLVRRPAGTGPAVRFAAFTGVTIAAYQGVPIRVKDIAQVALGHVIRRGGVTANGKGEAVLGLGFMLMGENSHEVTWSMKHKLDDVRKTLPANVQVTTVYDRTELVDHVIDTVRLSDIVPGAPKAR